MASGFCDVAFFRNQFKKVYSMKTQTILAAFPSITLNIILKFNRLGAKKHIRVSAIGYSLFLLSTDR
jgi:hypothetical protein